MQRRNYIEDKEKLSSFLHEFHSSSIDANKQYKYTHILTQAANEDISQIAVDLDDVADFDANLAEAITTNVLRYKQMFYDVIDDILPKYRTKEVQPMTPLDFYIAHQMQAAERDKIREEAAAGNATTTPNKPYGNLPPELVRKFEVNIKPNWHSKSLAIRDVRSAHIGHLISARGIVTRVSEVKPLLRVATYTCEQCGGNTHQPIAGLSFTPLNVCPSEACKANVSKAQQSRLVFETRASKFIKFQEVKIQEHTDQVPVGNVPRSLTIYCSGNNTDTLQPGDHVLISGAYLPAPRAGFQQVQAGLLTDAFLEADTIIKVNKSNDQLGENDEMTQEELNEIHSSANIYERLASSIAPEIYGHEDVKKALLLLLVGGSDSKVQGMKIRGNINICLMGDPGVAKSQLLSYIDRISPRSQYTTGRGSSGVGLTAAVLKDPLTGEMVLEGGALVLADRGVCCIDEFDKLLEVDRVAIHEVMEQQTVSIAKAGILTTLNARVSILAAANPAFGRYNPKKTLEENIQLPAALLSRFDILWLIQDRADRENDIRLAKHVAYVHQHNANPPREFEPLDMKIIRKYIALCKEHTPVVPPSLSNYIAGAYVAIRRDARGAKDSTYTSARIVLAVCRLATALARLRLQDEVEKMDVDEALRLLESSRESLAVTKMRAAAHRKNVDIHGQIFTHIRELADQQAAEGADSMEVDGGSRAREISINTVYARLAAIGFNQSQIDEAIEQYEQLDVWMVNQQRTRLTFCII